MTGAQQTIGFVGLGTIGRPIVENLLRAGVPVVVNDLDSSVVAELVELGATPADDLATLASQARIVGVCVPADAHVRTVLDGPDGLLAHLPAGAIVAIHSTVLPETVLWAAAEAERRGVRVVEAAVTGGYRAAKQGATTFLLGGDPATLDELDPMLSICGEARVHAGGLGDASRLKLCVNLQSYVTFTGVAEAARVAKAAGVSIEALKDALRANGQLNPLVETYLLLHEFSPETLADPTTRAALDSYAAIIEKDLVLIAALADEVGVEVPAARLAGRRARSVYFLDEAGIG